MTTSTEILTRATTFRDHIQATKLPPSPADVFILADFVVELAAAVVRLDAATPKEG